MSALLLGGPEVIGSLMDVVGRSPAAVFAYNARAPHPTPYLRTLISVELLRRMGFAEKAERYRRAWVGIYPPPPSGAMPPGLLETFPTACRLAVDAMCFRPYPSLGDKSLAQVVCFNEKDRRMTESCRPPRCRRRSGDCAGSVPDRRGPHRARPQAGPSGRDRDEFLHRTGKGIVPWPLKRHSSGWLAASAWPEEAFHSLRLTVIEDRPPHGEVLSWNG